MSDTLKIRRFDRHSTSTVRAKAHPRFHENKIQIRPSLTPALRPQVYTHLFVQVYERGVKNAMLRAVRAKARISVCLHPSLKAGVNERQIADNSVLFVTKLQVAYVTNR